MHHDFKVEGQGNIFYINKIVFHSFYHLFNVFSVSELYHSPGSDSRFYFQQVFKIRRYSAGYDQYKIVFRAGDRPDSFRP